MTHTLIEALKIAAVGFATIRSNARDEAIRVVALDHFNTIHDVIRTWRPGKAAWPEHGLTAAEWSTSDQVAAEFEGWAIFWGDVRGLEIARCDDDPGERFASDEEALQHVKKRAGEGSDMHKRALIINARSNPKEG